MIRTMFVVQQTCWWLEMGLVRGAAPYLLSMDNFIFDRHQHLRHVSEKQTTPCGLFATEADAAAECRRLTLLARPFFNPFWSTLDDPQSRQEQAFWDALFDHHVWDELTPEYAADQSEWCLWWEMCVSMWSDEQRNALWDALNIDLYQISEVEFAE